jgi:hypothetical protein
MGSKRDRNKKTKEIASTQTKTGIRGLLQYVKKKPLVSFVAVVSFVASVAGIASYFYYIHDKKVSAITGEISSAKRASVKYLSVGSTRFIIDSPDGVFLKDGDLPVFSMKLIKDKLLVTTTIRDSKGDIIAELKDNEWQVNKANIFDRNYTDDALEVRDQVGKVSLQVVHFGDTIHLAGVFRCRSGWTNVFCPLAEGGAVIDIKPPGVEPEHSILPIFEYPSERHFGSSPGLSSLEKLIIHGSGPAYRMGGALDICAGNKQQR